MAKTMKGHSRFSRRQYTKVSLYFILEHDSCFAWLRSFLRWLNKTLTLAYTPPVSPPHHQTKISPFQFPKMRGVWGRAEIICFR